MFLRRKRYKDRIEQDERRADDHLQVARELTDAARKAAQELQDTRLRNHFGEAVAASFQPRKPRQPRQPWRPPWSR